MIPSLVACPLSAQLLRIWVSVPRQNRTHNCCGARRKESVHGVVKGGEGAAPSRGSWPASKAAWPCASWSRRQVQALGQIPWCLAGQQRCASNACRSTAAITSFAAAAFAAFAAAGAAAAKAAATAAKAAAAKRDFQRASARDARREPRSHAKAHITWWHCTLRTVHFDGRHCPAAPAVRVEMGSFERGWLG